MCGPATPVMLMAAATAVSAISAGYSGMATVQQHKYEAAVARNNASLSRGQAADAEERGKREELRQAQVVSRAKSAQLAGFAANGIDVTFGSPVDVMADTAIMGLQDTWQIRDNAARETSGYLISAANYEGEARAQKAAARNAAVGTVLNVAGTVIGGASQVKGLQAKAGGFTPKPSASPSSGFGRPISW